MVKREKPSVFVADTETTSSADYAVDGHVRAYLWDIQRVDGLDRTKFCDSECDDSDDHIVGESMDAFFDWVEGRKNNTTVVWYYNLSFDGSFIADWALRNGYVSESFEDVVSRKNGKKSAIAKYLTENDLPSYVDGKPTYIPRNVVKAYDKPRKSFTVIKSGSSWIMMVLLNSKGRCIKFYDLGNKFTVLPETDDNGENISGVEAIAQLLGIEGKTSLDVGKRRDDGYRADEEEFVRCARDVEIIKEGCRLWYDWDMICSTLAGDAWKDYMAMCQMYYSDKAAEELSKKPIWEELSEDVKSELVKKKSKRLLNEIYPEKMPEQFTCGDTVIDIRDAYGGGIVYVVPSYVEKDVSDVNVIDRNSMHPSSMKFCKMPFGLPWTSIGEPKSERYIVKFSCSFKLKEGMFPTIQKKKSIRQIDAEWVYSTDGEKMELTLCDKDLEWFLKSYDIDEGWDLIDKYYLNFQCARLPVLGMYVDKWTAEKKRCKKERSAFEEGTAGWNRWNIMYYRAKIMQNALYGKFGQDPVKPYQWCTLEDDAIRIKESNCSKGEYFESYSSKYLGVACFVTAESRACLRDTMERLKDYAIYCDTDSVHFEYGGDVGLLMEKKGIRIDGSELGAWDIECVKETGRYIRNKAYIHIKKNGKLDVKCAGMPAKMKKFVTWDNFHLGSSFDEDMGKLRPVRVHGGTELVKCSYRIKG